MKLFNQTCAKCGKKVFLAGFYKKQRLCSKHHWEANMADLKKSVNAPKTITETKCTCKACGNIWFYGKQDKLDRFADSSSNLGKSMLCCTGCAPALLIPDKKVTDLNKCPKCNSAAVVKETVTHRV